MSAAQFDIFGETHSLASAAEPGLPRDAVAYQQPRLFEPQIEGQLNMLCPHKSERRPEAAPRTTTDTEDTTDVDG